MGRIVVVGYKPKQGKSNELEDLMKTHIQILREEEICTPSVGQVEARNKELFSVL